jgi:CelD/BcsL family acetyltransferase involved in cellulose biosynthesis
MNGDDPMASLSRNSREQIRRSIRHFEERGVLALERAQDVAEALAWFAEMERFHMASWAMRGQSGAFAETSFAHFHRCLITCGFDQGIPDLLRLTSGKDVLGFLYNFRWRGDVYAYQSGFVFGGDSRWRPGLVAHVMAMQRYQSEGLVRYRFLAGDSRYKNSLSNGADKLYWMTVHRPDLLHSVEKAARRLRHMIRQGNA